MITALKQRGYTIVMVEQNFRFAAPLADRFYVMEHGQIVEHFEAAELAEKQDTLNELLGVRTNRLSSPEFPAPHTEGKRSHPMKLHTITAALAAAGLGFAGATAQAQGISDDVIRVGFITDMSGVYSDIDGKGGLEAVRMAIEDAGGSINGKKIEVVSADHQNKADVASARVREWFDEQKVDVIIAGTNSSTSLAMAGVAGEKKSPSSPSARAPRT